MRISFPCRIASPLVSLESGNNLPYVYWFEDPGDDFPVSSFPTLKKKSYTTELLMQISQHREMYDLI